MSNSLHHQIYLDLETGNMYAVYQGALHSVNAVRNSLCAEDVLPPNETRRVFLGDVIDWRWRCNLNTQTEKRVARHFVEVGIFHLEDVADDMDQAAHHIPASDPLCAELQGGHDNYSEGLVLSLYRHGVDAMGNWLVNVDGETPERDRRAGRTVANVHPVQADWDQIKQYQGRWVYAVRFWEKPAEVAQRSSFPPVAQRVTAQPHRDAEARPRMEVIAAIDTEQVLVVIENCEALPGQMPLFCFLGEDGSDND